MCCNKLLVFSRRQKTCFLPSNKNLIFNPVFSKNTQSSKQPPNNHSISHSLITPLPPTQKPLFTALASEGHIANADTGATGNYISLSDIKCVRDIQISTPHEQIKVQVANGKVELSSHHGYLDVPGAGAMIAYIFPTFKGSLISISQIVNLGLTVTYCNNFVTFLKDNIPIFQGNRDPQSGLWMIDLTAFSTPGQDRSANLVIRHDSVADMCNFWHATFGYPALSTFTPAVEKAFIQIPGLTARRLRSHPPNPTETAAGHLDATRQGQRSTKIKLEPVTPSVNMDTKPLAPTHCIWHRVQPVKVSRAGRNHSDATAAFPIAAQSGALYQHVFYSEDCDFIHVETSKSRSAQDLLAAAQRAYKFFADRGAAPTIIRMDNECSQLMKDWIGRLTMTLELTPVAQHRTNKAEREIRVWKNHFIATLAGIDPECPLSLWEELIGQAELTLNLMRASPTNPSISAWEHLCGHFDINATPIAPLGTKVMVHDTPEKRGSWQAHGQVGFYVGRALNHYRCYTVWMPSTRALRTSDCLSWHPIKVHMPGSSPIEELTAALGDIERALLRIADTPALANSRQPITDAATTVSQQIRAVTSLFRPPQAPTTTTDGMAPPPGFTQGDLDPIRRLGSTWSGTEPLSQFTRPILPAAIQRVSTGSAPMQLTPPAALKRVSTGNAPTLLIPLVAPTQTDPSVHITVSPNQVISMPPKTRAHAYLTLSPAEINKLSSPTVKCIGMQFIDNQDPDDTATGTVTEIMRHKKTRKLVFQYWDHTVHSIAPKRLSDHEFINVQYAINSCTWQKSSTPAALNAQSVSLSQPRVEWYHKLDQFTGEQRDRVQRELALAHPDWVTPQQFQKLFPDLYAFAARYAFTAMDMNDDGTPLTSTSALQGPERDRWMIAHGEEIIRIIESNTGRLIFRHEMPSDRKAAYYNPQLKIKHKPEGVQYRVRGTIGGDQIEYPGAKAAYTATLETIRALLNAVVSEDAMFFTADIKDFYLGTPLDRPEYMRISLKHIPPDVQARYSMAPFVHNGHVLMEINTSIYGLPQAGKLSQDRLVSHLASNGYRQCTNTPCLFVHDANGIAFTLVVDDFLIKYKDKAAADHLMTTLRGLYEITTDFSNVQKYVGITLKHNKLKRTIDMSMPGYVQKALSRFKRTSLRGADSPIIYVPPRYGKFQQEVLPDEPSTPLTPAEKLELQEIVGVFLFYARAVDPTMYTAINKIGSKQAKPTSLIKKEIERFFQYASKWPDATMRIRASNMKLVCHSDGSYLSESEARSRAGGILFLGDCADNAAPNAPICFISVIIPTVVASATEAEYAAAFLVGQAATSIIHTLTDLGYPQSETEIFCDNVCAVGIAQNTLQIKRAKTIDMRYHWLRDQVHQKKLKVIWKAGKLNLADFFTKAHPVHHHLAIRWKYVLSLGRTKHC